jgi:hypothetical protein
MGSGGKFMPLMTESAGVEREEYRFEQNNSIGPDLSYQRVER